MPRPSASVTTTSDRPSFGQECRHHGLANAVAVVGYDDGGQRQPDVARPRLGQHQGRGHAADRAGIEQPALAAVRISAGAQRGHRQHDEQIGQRQRRGPGQRGPRGTPADHADKIRAEHRREDHGGVAGIREAVHGPGPDFAFGHAGIQGACVPCPGVRRGTLVRSARLRSISRPTRQPRPPHGRRR
ncbi:hypothetical protein G6F22_017782 [Rhizopus arrhizus]|nr:hypothetical protein G6F22_017782 [Rhizopus arrhizus]